MARLNEVFNVAGVAVTIDGRIGSDFADDFAFEVEFPDELSTTVMGVDKAATFIKPDTTVTVTVKCKLTSDMVDQYMSLYNDQNTGFARLINITCTSGVNTNLSFHNCAIKTFGTISYGTKDTMPMVSAVFSVQKFITDKAA